MLGYAAEALANAGDWAGARQELEAAMQCADAIGEREYLPQLLVLEARIADALGEREAGGRIDTAGHRRSARSGSTVA